MSPKLTGIYQTLHQHMDKPGFRPLIQAASEIFQAPVVFTDQAYQLVSLYPTEKIGDEVYDALLETGGLPEETISAFLSEYLNQPGKRYDPFFVKDGLVKDHPRIFAEVYDEDNGLGHVAVFLKDVPFEPWHLQATSILTDILRIKVKLTNQMPAVHADTLQYLLDPSSTTQAKGAVMSQLASFRLDDAWLLVAPLEQTRSQHAFALVVVNYVLHKYPSVIPTIHQDDLIMLITPDELRSNRAIAEEISDYLSQYHLFSGAVQSVGDMFNLSLYYRQAKLTAQYRDGLSDANRTKLIYYHEIAPAPIFLLLSQQPEAQGFIHPLLETIEQYDQANDTHYLETLESYCQHLFGKNETAEALYLHRNTLNYRLSRIEELFELDLKDYTTLIHLMMSFEIKRYLT